MNKDKDDICLKCKHSRIAFKDKKTLVCVLKKAREVPYRYSCEDFKKEN